MTSKLKTLIPVLIFSLLPTLVVWLPFFLRIQNFWSIPLPQTGMETIVANYDGPLYLVVAKTFYNAAQISQNFAFSLPIQYYAAHFPLFPLLIRALAEVTLLVYPYAMLAVTVSTSTLAIYFFYKLIRQYSNESQALWLTFIFSVFPARWLIVRSVGSPEPLFVGSIIASIYYFQNKKYLKAGIWGAVAQATKSPAILLFAAYFLIIGSSAVRKSFKKLEIKAYPIFLIPLSLLGVFFIYQKTFNNFFAYFSSGDNIHLFFPPFQIFNYSAPWVGTFWLEEIIFIYLFGVLGLLQLIKQKETVLAWCVAIFFVSTIFVSHRDLMRYSLPIFPFLIVAFRDFLVKREFKLALAFILIPIYLFSLAFISQNAMAISNWSGLL